MKYTITDIAFLGAAVLGLILAALSGLSEHVSWLGNWCASFSDGCRETASFTLLRVPVWAWGTAYYLALIEAILCNRGRLAWLIPVGVGAEITLAAIMGLIKAVCIFCLGNAVVVLILAILFVRQEVSWRALALTLAALMASAGAIGAENGIYARLCPQQPMAAQGGATPDGATIVPPGVISLTGSQVTGPANAPVTVILYSDFRCPACRRGHPAVAEAMKLYAGKVRWVFKNFPLPMHQDAAIAAEGALCAADQGRFWEYQDALYEYQGEFTPDSLTEIAASLKLDSRAFRNALDSGAHKQQVDREMREGVLAGINAVPSLVINGKVSTGAMPLPVLRTKIDEALAQSVK